MPSATFRVSSGSKSNNEALAKFLTSWDKKETKFSLRAIKKETLDNTGAKQITYELFKRNGKEGLCERLVNFFDRETQRQNAREAIKYGFSFADEKSKADFQSEINGMHRLVLGEKLTDIVLSREVSPEKLADSKPIVDESVTQVDAVNIAGVADSHSASTVMIRFAEENNGTRQGTTASGERKSRKNIFSAFSIFNYAPLFVRGDEKKKVFSKSACAVAKSLVGLKKHRQKHVGATANEKPISAPEPSGIHLPETARLNGGIQVKLMENLDVQDLHPSVAVLMRNTEEYFSMTEECRAWLRKRKAKLPRDSADNQANKFAKLEIDQKIAYLAPHEENKPNQQPNRKSTRDLAEIYKQAVDDAVENQRPLVLTPLFHYEENTINQHITAMLAPVYSHLRARRTVKLEIRTTCRKIAGTLERYQRQYPSSPLKLDGAAVPQIRKRLHEKDLTSEGMIMMTPETLSLAGKKSGKTLDAAWKRFMAQPDAEAVQPRKSLEENAWERCYFFGKDSANRKAMAMPGAQAARKASEWRSDAKAEGSRTVVGLSAGAIALEIEASYRAAFKAASDNGCRFLTVPSLEGRYLASFPEEVAAVQIIGILCKLKSEFPSINVTLLTQNPHVRQHFHLLESAV